MVVQDAADLTVAAAGLHPSRSVEEVARRVVDTARDLVQADACGVLRFAAGGLSPFVATDQLAASADTHQVLGRCGPAMALLDRYDSDQSSICGPVKQWNHWYERVKDLRLAAAAAIPLRGHRRLLGVLTTYHRDATVLAHLGEDILGRFAVHAAIAWESARREEELREGMAGRHTIGLAQGILIERFGLSTDQAFAVLRRYSQQGNIKLRTLAEQLVETGHLPDQAQAVTLPGRDNVAPGGDNDARGGRAVGIGAIASACQPH